jgi:hypothetical protein
VEKHELSKIDFELIDDAFKALLRESPFEPMFCCHQLTTSAQCCPSRETLGIMAAWQC